MPPTRLVAARGLLCTVALLAGCSAPNTGPGTTGSARSASPVGDPSTAAPGVPDGVDEVRGASIDDTRVAEGPSGQDVALNIPESEAGPEAPTVIAPALWWTWIAPADGAATFATHSSEMDTVLTAFSGTSQGLLEVGSNDDVGDVVTSSLTFPVQEGATYYVRVEAKGGEAGLVNLTWETAP